MIYFAKIEELNLVKIGYATDSRARLRFLRAGCPYRLKLIASEDGDRLREACLHEEFSHLRANLGGGREWFHCEGEILDYLHSDWRNRVEVWCNGLPVLFGIVSKVVEDDYGNRDYCRISVKCPRCREENRHGFMPGRDWGICSRRRSHCKCNLADKGAPDRFYYIAANPDTSLHAIDPIRPLSSRARKAMLDRSIGEAMKRIPYFENLEV